MQFRFLHALVLGLCVAVTGGLPSEASAQGARVSAGGGDPVRVSPDHYRVLIENDYVRVLDIRHQPGESDEMHNHPKSAYFVLSGDKMRFHLERSQRDGDVVVGSVTLQDPIVMHAVENIGETPLHLIMVERKGDNVARVDGEDVVDVSGSMYQQVDENRDFRVLNVTLEPGQRDEPHARPASVLIALGPSSGTWHQPGQDPMPQVFRPGSALYVDAAEEISLENTGERPIRFIQFELLR
jgi:mannose-6-phosphate isomerase-like protein (cupin superfamily)